MDFVELPTRLASAVIHGLGFVSETESPEPGNRRWECAFELDVRSLDDVPDGFAAVYVPSRLVFYGVDNISIDADSMGGDPTFLLIHDVIVRELDESGARRYSVTFNGDWFTIEVRARSTSLVDTGARRPVNRIGLTDSDRSSNV